MKKNQAWFNSFRALIPSWLFFGDQAGGLSLWVRHGSAENLSAWKPVFTHEKRKWRHLLINSSGNERLYVNSLVERLYGEVQDLEAGAVESSTSYQLLVGRLRYEFAGETFQFKICGWSLEVRALQDYLLSRLHGPEL